MSDERMSEFPTLHNAIFFNCNLFFTFLRLPELILLSFSGDALWRYGHWQGRFGWEDNAGESGAVVIKYNII